MEGLLLLLIIPFIAWIYIQLFSERSSETPINTIKDKENSFWDRFDAVKIAGKKGENEFKDIIYAAMNDEDYVFFNKEINYQNRITEVDSVIVNKFGVFIFEVKNFSGTIVGKLSDDEWQKETTSTYGNRYVKTIKNPIRQVKREIHLLASVLRNSGIKVWVKGYVYFINGNSPTDSEYVVWSSSDIDHQIHKTDRYLLSAQQVDAICAILSGKM